MKIIEATNTLDAFKKAQSLLKQLAKPLDEELTAEMPLLIVFTKLDTDINLPIFDGKIFKATTDYTNLINKNEAFVQQEFDHYANLLVGQVDTIIKYLQQNPLSKRAIIDVWDDKQRNLQKPAECLVYMVFRETTNGLDMHVHMRANDAKTKALLNFHIFAAIHHYVAKKIKKNVGIYYHYSNSYHLYK
ncbi:MAG: thymidylate synthase [bacterium]|nr:thymidylate synthase [bacterium]